MINIFFDNEGTDLNPYVTNIIEAYFYVNDDINYYYKARPDSWNENAEKVHKISYAQALTYPDKKDALSDLAKWFKQFKSFRFITFANKNTELGVINYDVCALWNEFNLQGYPQYFLENELGMKAPLSVHDTAKYCAKQGYFTPIRGKSGRQSFTQENVYYALFQEKYNSHNCIDDTLALVKIYNKLLQLNNESNSDLFWHQTNNS
jgi:DNA polymerase III epsilon subunit-like protein